MPTHQTKVYQCDEELITELLRDIGFDIPFYDTEFRTGFPKTGLFEDFLAADVCEVVRKELKVMSFTSDPAIAESLANSADLKFKLTPYVKSVLVQIESIWLPERDLGEGEKYPQSDSLSDDFIQDLEASADTMRDRCFAFFPKYLAIPIINHIRRHPR